MEYQFNILRLHQDTKKRLVDVFNHLIADYEEVVFRIKAGYILAFSETGFFLKGDQYSFKWEDLEKLISLIIAGKYKEYKKKIENYGKKLVDIGCSFEEMIVLIEVFEESCLPAIMKQYRDSEELSKMISAFYELNHLNIIILVNSYFKNFKKKINEKNEALKKGNLELRELNNLKNKYLYFFTHELGNILSNISGSVDILLNCNLSDKEQEKRYLEVILNSSDKLAETINEILILSKLKENKEKLFLKEVDFRDFLLDIIKDKKIIAEQQGVALDYDINVLGKAKIDPDKMYKVVQNLLGNALKFTDEGKVLLEAKKENNILEITVSDTGEGIAEKDQEIIFDEFKRANKKRLGSGLGLAICKCFVELHGGTIKVKSCLGKGSEFTVRIPIEQ